jgi:arginyl-tRNA synthetase
MIAVGFEKYGNEEELEQDPIKHLYKIYVQITKDAEADPEVKAAAAAWFARMEAGEDAALANWRKWRALSVRKYAEEYARLNIAFDVYTGESEVGREWQDRALARLGELGLIEDVGGAKLVDLEKWKLQKAVLRKKGPCGRGLTYRKLTTSQTARQSTSRATSAVRSNASKSMHSTR